MPDRWGWHTTKRACTINATHAVASLRSGLPGSASSAPGACPQDREVSSGRRPPAVSASVIIAPPCTIPPAVHSRAAHGSTATTRSTLTSSQHPHISGERHEGDKRLEIDGHPSSRPAGTRAARRELRRRLRLAAHGRSLSVSADAPSDRSGADALRIVSATCLSLRGFPRPRRQAPQRRAPSSGGTGRAPSHPVLPGTSRSSTARRRPGPRRRPPR
jgi:hypothetical protein